MTIKPSLTQVEADALMRLEKFRKDDKEWSYPELGGSISIPLVSRDQREPFLLDLRRARIDLRKSRYQTRARQVVILARLDLGNKPHRNPDGELIGSPHLHLYREGFDDKWAFPVPDNEFRHLDDTSKTLQDFMQFCNVVKRPHIRLGLFA